MRQSQFEATIIDKIREHLAEGAALQAIEQVEGRDPVVKVRFNPAASNAQQMEAFETSMRTTFGLGTHIMPVEAEETNTTLAMPGKLRELNDRVQNVRGRKLPEGVTTGSGDGKRAAELIAGRYRKNQGHGR